MKQIARVLATWFYCGYAPKAPGTAGSLAAIAIAWLIPAPPWAFAIFGLALAAPGIWAAGVTARELGRTDPGIVVVDEVAGQWITLAGAAHLNWQSFLIAFVLFRLFDIWKPPPVRQLEKLPGGLGIVADDVMAGVYGAVVLYGCTEFLGL
ncbi:MAG TPA: phosphatidylglycerophosphatase A [Bryobacteraceae bacterium]|nr:phosphatidylglycerophosphatase A [Bryobacteraceae bacterium]